MAQEINLKFGASLSGGAKAVFTSLANGLKEVAKGMQILAKEQLKLGNKENANSLNTTAKALNNLGKEIKTGVKDNKNYAKSQEEVIKSGSKLQSVFKKLGTSMQTYARYMVASNIMQGFIGGFQSAVTAIIEFDQALHDLKAITQASAVETLLLGASIVQVAALTKFSMGEVGGAMKKLGQAGFTATEITGMIGGIAELATGSLESLDVTVSLVSTAIRVFGMDVSKTAEVVDIFANAVTKSRLTIAGLSTTFNYIGPIAAATGLNLKDTSASMMLLANAGLRFSTIGTGLRRIIGGLAKPSGRFKDAILAAGYSLADFNPNLTDFRDIITKIPDVIKDSTDAIEFFGYRGSSVISAFSTQGVKEYDRLRAAVDRVGTTTEMAAEQMKGLQNAIKNIKDRFGVLAKTLAEGGILTIFKALVDVTRKLLSVLIFLSGTIAGQIVVTMTLLATATTIATTALLAFISIGLGSILTTWVGSLVAVTGAFTGVGISAFTASTGVITLSSAFAGLFATVTTFFLTNPIGIAILAITSALVVYLAVTKSVEKGLRTASMESEKYSDALGKTIGKMEAYNESVEKNGENSKESKTEALKLREGVMTLADEYEGISDPLYEFTKKIDENTGSMIGNESAIKGLKNVLLGEYESAVLEGAAATERLIGITNASTSTIIRNTAKYKANGIVIDYVKEKYKAFAKTLFGTTFNEDPLGLDGLKRGAAILLNIQAEADRGNSKAVDNIKQLNSEAQSFYDLLLKKGKTEKELRDMTNKQMRNEILNLLDLKVAHTATAAALFDLMKKKRDLYSPEKEKRDRELYDLAVIREGYKAFGLEMDGVSIKLKKWMTNFEKLRVITGKHAVSTEDLVKAFEKVGDSVKTAADFDLFFEAMTTLKKHTGITEADLIKLAEITKEAFDNIRNSAKDLKTILDEEFRIFDIEEQKAITEQWQSYVDSTNTEHAITEKAHTKILEKIHLDFLRKKMVGTNVYFNSLDSKYKKDGLVYQEALVDKLNADQAYLKGQAAFNKPDTSGTSGRKGKTNEMKISEELFEASLDRQTEAAKTMNAELKASYDTDILNLKEYYAIKQVATQENIQKEKDLIGDRILAVKKEYEDQANYQTEKEARQKVEMEGTKKIIELKNELNDVNEKGKQTLAKLTAEEYKALETQERKVIKLQDEQLKKTENSRLLGDQVTEEQKYQTKVDQLKRYHTEKLQAMSEAGATEYQLLLTQDLMEEELFNLKLDREKQIYYQRLDNAQQFGGDMANITKDLMSAGLLQSKKFFKAYQAFAIAETMISTYSSAQKAFDNAIAAGGPWSTAMGYVAAAAAVASGMARVASISAQKPEGYAKGGLIGGSRGGPKEDNININASRGEFMQQNKAVKHYGVAVMDGLNNLTIPKSLFEGFTDRKRSVQSSYALADGGLVPSINKKEDIQINGDDKQPINIINVTDSREIGTYLATSEGSNALLNVLSSKSEAVKRILR